MRREGILPGTNLLANLLARLFTVVLYLNQLEYFNTQLLMGGGATLSNSGRNQTVTLS